MSSQSVSSRLPEYQTFADSIAMLSLPISGSELHGMMCGFLCAGAVHKGEEYIRALMMQNINDASKAAILALFDVYTTSHQQIEHLDFEG